MRILDMLLLLFCVTHTQVNAALEEMAGYAATCYKHMALVSRNQLTRVAAEERQRLHELYHAVEVRCWHGVTYGGGMLGCVAVDYRRLYQETPRLMGCAC